MRDTEPFTPARVRVKMLALPVYPAVLTTPEVKCVQMWRQRRRIRCGPVNAVLFLAHSK